MIRLALRVRREDAEVALAELLALAPAGVEECELDDGSVELAVYGPPGELPALPDLQAAAGPALVEVSTRELPDDWGERWKSFHRPLEIPSCGGAPGLRVRPPWEPARVLAGGEAVGAVEEIEVIEEIVIDPAQAFGTGAHDTTRMCLELLLALAGAEGGRRGSLLDVGCGSGVLGIAAARLGFAPVLGVDHDPESVRATQDNTAANGVALDVRRLDLRREPLPRVGGAAPDTILANLVRPLLLDLASSLSSPPRHLIASGLLREEADELAAAFRERHGLRERERLHGGEWAALWLCRAD